MHKDRINWLDIYELAEYLHLGKSTIERFLADGKFPQADYCINGHRRRLWTMETVNKYVEEYCRNIRKEQSA